MAIDTHWMLMELVEKQESILAWKKSAFPDFCFHPPYTDPSVAENAMLPVTGQFPLGNFPDASYLPLNNVSYFSSLFPDQTSSQHPALDSRNPSLLDSSFSEVGQSFANVQSSSAAPAALASTPISS
jgi:hypothetical protein